MTKYKIQVISEKDKYRRYKEFTAFLPTDTQNVKHAIVDVIREYGILGPIRYKYEVKS